jgi:polyisoprenoid-binding protein YceI
MKTLAALLAPALLVVTPVFAASWTVDPARSHLGFSGVQNGEAFKGAFGKWTADISFDPAHPEAGSATVSIDMASAGTGDVQRDAALPQAEWFDLKTSPLATFEAKGFIAKGGDAYEAPGRLTIRGVSKNVVLPFNLTIKDGKAQAKGHLTLVRTDFGVGQGVWKTDEWVALDVGVDVDISATAR